MARRLSRVSLSLRPGAVEQGAAVRGRARPGSMVVPPYPINGHDIAGLGIAPGRPLVRNWPVLRGPGSRGGFALGKGELLALVKR